MLFFGRRLRLGGSPELLGYMIGRIRLDDFFGYIAVNPDWYVSISDDDGKMLYTAGTALTDSRVSMVMSSEISGTPWNLVIEIPREEMWEGTGSIVKVTIVLSLTILVLTAVLGLLFARFFARRIENLSGVIREFQNGNFNVRAETAVGDEITDIADAFNDMAGVIEGLMRTTTEIEAEKRTAEVNLLKAQINPHFLYNSLSSINHLVKMGKNEESYRLVLLLTRFYRLTLNKGSAYIPLKEEIQRVSTYMEINKIKYRERLIFTLDTDESLDETLIPDFILQPVLENTVIHAWIDRPLSISVATRSIGKRLQISVSDDGVGMNPQNIEKLLGNTSSDHGFGLFYVRQRLSNFYRNDYKFKVVSQPGHGTKITFLLPKTRQGNTSADQDYYPMYQRLRDHTGTSSVSGKDDGSSS